MDRLIFLEISLEKQPLKNQSEKFKQLFGRDYRKEHSLMKFLKKVESLVKVRKIILKNRKFQKKLLLQLD